MSDIERKCDRCGETIDSASPVGELNYSQPWAKKWVSLEICSGCDSELKAFWNMESGEIAKDKLDKARNKSEGIL